MLRTSLVAQVVKCLPTMWETWVRSLGQEDPLEKEVATRSSILTWKILWTEEPGTLQSSGSQRVRHNWATLLSFSLFMLHTGRMNSKVLLHSTENYIQYVIINHNEKENFKKNVGGEEPRWRRNRTGRPLSLLQIHQKNNWRHSKLHKTTSDR